MKFVSYKMRFVIENQLRRVWGGCYRRPPRIVGRMYKDRSQLYSLLNRLPFFLRILLALSEGRIR